MKRLSQAHKRWLIRYSRRAWQVGLREKIKRADRRRGTRLKKVLVERDGRRVRRWATPLGIVPENFCIEQNYERSVRFLQHMRTSLNQALLGKLRSQGAKRREKPTYFDLVPVKRVSPAAALMFAAEYDRAIAVAPDWKLSTYNAHRWTPEVRLLLDQIGFLELLSIQRPKEADMTPGHMRMTRFSQSEAGFGNAEAAVLLTQVANLLELQNQYGRDATQLIGPTRLFDALIEATENTRLHAYDGSTEDSSLLVKRWWMTGAVDRAEGKLTVIVYDRGATIPATLPRSRHWGRIRKALARILRAEPDASLEHDAVSLHLAMSRGVSSTGLEFRGKGLPVLKRVVNECPKGRLLIISRHGNYQHETGKKAVYNQLTVPLNGTLIQWDLWRPEWKSAT